MSMTRLLMSELWIGSNEIKSKVVTEWNNKDTTKTFKQYCNTKEGKQLINDITMRYIDKAKDQLSVQFIQSYVKGDELLIEIESDVYNIISLLSYKCGTSLGFMDATYKLDYVS